MNIQTGSLVVTYITSLPATWISLLILLTLHLTLNYAAVRSVQMTSLNRQRANIAFSTLLESDGALVSLVPSTRAQGGIEEEEEEEEEEERKEWKILTPAQVAQRESIFERDGILKWYPYPNSKTSPAPVSVPKVLGYGYIGIPIHQFLTTTNNNNAQTTLPTLSNLFTEETYLLHISPLHNGHTTRQATILLKQSSTPRSQLKAWMHALLVLRVLSSYAYPSSSPDDGKVLQVLEQSLVFLNQGGRFDKYMVALEEHGWELDIAALETRSGRRVSLV